MTRCMWLAAWLGLVSVGAGAAPVRAEPTAVTDRPLADYVSAEDGVYGYELVERRALGPHALLVVRLTSQQWRGQAWRHWLGIVVPANVSRADRAVLVITGGSDRDLAEPPELPADPVQSVTGLASTLGVPVAVLSNVPNQPAFGGKQEDALIAHTFDRYLETGDADWPLLLPMTKSAVRAMDAVADVLEDEGRPAPQQFIVSGASKRGWTTYLTGAVDERVLAIVPMVFDMLNMAEQVPYQRRSLGRFRRRIHDYTDAGILERMDTPRGQALMDVVDPFAYRDRLAMPKFVVLGTNDRFWTTDASRLYADQLEGPTWLFYDANRGHGLSLNAVPAIMGFMQAVLADTTPPPLSWSQTDDALIVECPAAGATATRWSAVSDTRDFSGARWTPTLLTGSSPWTVLLDVPEQGFAATYVEVTVPRETGLPFRACTPIIITPDTYPHASADASP